jgi:hypothetical protein
MGRLSSCALPSAHNYTQSHIKIFDRNQYFRNEHTGKVADFCREKLAPVVGIPDIAGRARPTSEDAVSISFILAHDAAHRHKAHRHDLFKASIRIDRDDVVIQGLLRNGFLPVGAIRAGACVDRRGRVHVRVLLHDYGHI